MALSALGQPTRLDAFRLLVQAGETGLLAGEMSTAMDVRPNTLSSNLALLVQAGLITNRREGRAIRYRVRMAGMQALLAFLMEDCCGGRPDICRPVLDQLACGDLGEKRV